MGFVFDLLTSPVLAPIKGVHWLAEKVAEEAERQYLDEDRVRAELVELEMRLEMGEITEEQYARQERILVEWLSAIREAKAERGQQR
jgi:uncharacterized membrane protein